ncbi:PREDICTED: uncharacterized protein LOC107192190 [Dufourea novaeangliae]|uniref:uncharacterized protein LOC107192190 n=1 Tax=Dufourea novaeangliae TaxID=178035 RepID=UPI000767A9E7|nr:PREDICTED: uncharacterized protein LOC107192190 [Dufourea novaeangliae]
MTSLNHEKNQSHDFCLSECLSQNLELKVVKNLLSTSYNIFQRKQKVLKEERAKLDNINYSVWATEDKFCNEVWNFSLEHNFNVFFNQFSDINEVIKFHNCKYSTAAYDNKENIDKYKESRVMELKNEINSLNNEITVIHNKNIEEDIKNATYVLNNLKSFSEEIIDLIRLISTSENSQNICNISTYQESNANKGFMSAKKLFKKHPAILVEKKVTTTSNIIINNSKKVQSIFYNTCDNVKNNIGLGKFVMKRQSLISLKLERMSKN